MFAIKGSATSHGNISHAHNEIYRTLDLRILVLPQALSAAHQGSNANIVLRRCKPSTLFSMTIVLADAVRLMRHSALLSAAAVTTWELFLKSTVVLGTIFAAIMIDSCIRVIVVLFKCGVFYFGVRYFSLILMA